MTRAMTADVRRDVEDALRDVRRGRPAYIRRKGRNAYVLLSAHRYRKLLEAAEDAADIAAAREAEKEPGTIPWEQIKCELGLDRSSPWA